jgi:hypothetical protein
MDFALLIDQILYVIGVLRRVCDFSYLVYLIMSPPHARVLVEVDLELDEETHVSIRVATPHIEAFWLRRQRKYAPPVQLWQNQLVVYPVLVVRKQNPVENIAYISACSSPESNDRVKLKRIIQSGRLCESDPVVQEHTIDHVLVIAEVLEEGWHL